MYRSAPAREVEYFLKGLAMPGLGRPSRIRPSENVAEQAAFQLALPSWGRESGEFWEYRLGPVEMITEGQLHSESSSFIVCNYNPNKVR